MSKVLVLGLGLQGKAVVHDLSCGDLVSQIVVADMDLPGVQKYLEQKKYTRCAATALNAAHEDDLEKLIRSVNPRVTICMLPPEFNYPAAKAALNAGCHYVSSSYTGQITELDAQAREKGITIFPEMGMDPGIDLILGRLAVGELDKVAGLYSYGAGLPEPDCAGDNPLGYKITWTFDGVLKAYKRPARILKDGAEVSIAGEGIFKKEHGHMVEVEGLGTLEAYPNGDAIHYIQVFSLGPEIKDMGRFALRYPGHSQFWRIMAQMGFLDDTPLGNKEGAVSPRRFLVDHLTPRLQFGPDQRDMVVLRVVAWGEKNGARRRVTYDMVDFRDLDTGLFAMNRTVGYTTAIASRMILDGPHQTDRRVVPGQGRPRPGGGCRAQGSGHEADPAPGGMGGCIAPWLPSARTPRTWRSRSGTGWGSACTNCERPPASPAWPWPAWPVSPRASSPKSKTARPPFP